MQNVDAVRRSVGQDYALDPLAAVKGQEAAKRALLVAIAGCHSILFVGPQDAAKREMRAVADYFGLEHHHEAMSCLCGDLGTDRACRCTATDRQSVISEYPDVDIYTQMPTPSAKELQTNLLGTSSHDLRHTLSRFLGPCRDLDDTAGYVLSLWSRNHKVSRDRKLKVLSIAKTIAGLDLSQSALTHHVVEAINYGSGWHYPPPSS